MLTPEKNLLEFEDVNPLRLWQHFKPPRVMSRSRKVAENLLTSDALYPLIRMHINDWLEARKYKPWVGFPGWTHLIPDPPVIGRDIPIGPRSYNFTAWFFDLLNSCMEDRPFIRVAKSSSVGAPFFTSSILVKQKIFEHVCKLSWSDLISNKQMFPHCLAEREQTNDPFGKVRKGPEAKFESVAIFEEMVMDPSDEILKNFGLQKPRGRTPRMVSLYINLKLMKFIQKIDLSLKTAKSIPNLCLSGDPAQMEQFLQVMLDAGYQFYVSFDRVKSEFNHHPRTIEIVADWMSAPLRELILNWNWIVRGIVYNNAYMGNPSGIAPVLILNLAELFSNLEYLGIISEKGIKEEFAVLALGDAALILCKSAESRDQLKSAMSKIDILSVNAVDIIGQKMIEVKEGKVYLRQDPVKTLMNFWSPEVDAGSSDRPFYGFGVKQRWEDFRGDQIVRQEFEAFEQDLLHKFMIQIDLKKPPENSRAYDVFSYYSLISQGKRKEAEEIAPFLFNLFRSQDLKEN